MRPTRIRDNNMKKLMTILAATALMFAVVLSTGCKKDSSSASSSVNGGGGNGGGGNGGGGGGGGGQVASGLFSVNETQKVYFAPGNLQYQASTGTWRFAEHAWDYVGATEVQYGVETGGTVSGSSNHLISPSYNGWIDMFGWGTGNNPTNVSTDEEDYPEFIDWGINAISNAQGSWRTLSREEWYYVLRTRTTNSGRRYTFALLHEVPGYLLLPDDWNNSTYNLEYPSQGPYANELNDAAWNTLQSAGVVFVPAVGGYRVGTGVRFVGLSAHYWTTTTTSSGRPNYMPLGTSSYEYLYGDRYEGMSVRLVRNQ